MPTTGYGYPYPAVGAVPDVPGDIYSLAAFLESLTLAGTVSFAGTVANSGGGCRLSRTLRTGSLVVGVNIGANGLTSDGVVLTTSFGPPAKVEEMFMLYDPSNVLRGYVHLYFQGTVLAFARAYIDGAAQTSVPANWRLQGTMALAW